MYHALVVGLRDYVTKNGFPGVLLGLSGGIDSALSAAVAVDALGPQAVLVCYVAVSVYVGAESPDAQAVVDLLGVGSITLIFRLWFQHGVDSAAFL